MTNSLVSRRYADALFSLGQKNNAINDYGTGLMELARVVAEEPKLAKAFKSPVISVNEKKALLSSILDKMEADKVLRNFCFLLADKNRLSELTGISDWYGSLLDNANGILRGKVITAIPLSQDRREKLKNSLEEKAGSKMILDFEVDPDILGGMVLAIGDKVLDTSLRAQLGILGDILKRGK